MTDKQIIEIQQEIQQIELFLNEEKQQYETRIKEPKERRQQLSKLRQQLFFQNKMYCPLEKLEEFKGQDIYEISLVFGDGTFDCFYCGDIIKVNEDGRFYFSDEHRGIVEYNKGTNKYYHYCFGSTEELDIVGFYNLTIGNYWDNQQIQETTMEELIKC